MESGNPLPGGSGRDPEGRGHRHVTDRKSPWRLRRRLTNGVGQSDDLVGQALVWVQNPLAESDLSEPRPDLMLLIACDDRTDTVDQRIAALEQRVTYLAGPH